MLDHPAQRLADEVGVLSLIRRLTTSSAVILVVSAIVVLLSSNLQQVRRSWAGTSSFRPAPSYTTFWDVIVQPALDRKEVFDLMGTSRTGAR